MPAGRFMHRKQWISQGRIVHRSAESTDNQIAQWTRYLHAERARQRLFCPTSPLFFFSDLPEPYDASRIILHFGRITWQIILKLFRRENKWNMKWNVLNRKYMEAVSQLIIRFYKPLMTHIISMLYLYGGYSGCKKQL